MIISYVITVFNKEQHIAEVIDSLYKIKGSYKKEFIIIDDGSTDSSLKIIREKTKNLPNTLVITQQNAGPSFAINKGIRLSHGNYIHFIDGDDIISPYATEILLKAIQDFGVGVSYGLRGTFDKNSSFYTSSKREDGSSRVIDLPIAAILDGKITGIRSIGSSGSLVGKDILGKIIGADTNVFAQDLSISLRCAKYTKFAFVSKTVSYSPATYREDRLSYNRSFERYNTLVTIYNFIQENKEIADHYKDHLRRALWSTIWKEDKTNINISFKYLMSKITQNRQNIDHIAALYKKEIQKLF
jgi:glycosyltransferase involved in cell wall biosynthesis